MSILKVDHLKKVYTTRFGGQQVQALRDVNFSVEEGEFIAIMGESGSGKTTLLNILAALDKPTGGTVLLDGRNLVDIKEIQDEWCNEEGINVHLTIDRPQEGWDGHVGFVPSYVNELNLSLDKTILICGPPIMIKFTLQNLQALGFSKSQVYTTMELRMKCGIGKCGRCNIGSKYVCKDGPVFRFDQLDELPDEY